MARRLPGRRPVRRGGRLRATGARRGTGRRRQVPALAARRGYGVRIHRTHEILRPWSTGTPVLDAGRLAVVRIEPVLRQRRPALGLHLYLAGDAGDTIIPTVFADPAVAVAHECDPLIFPHGTPGDDAFAFA